MKMDETQLSPEELAKAERIAFLVFLFIRKEISQEEQLELDNWIAESDENVLLFEDLIEEDNLEDMKKRISKIDTAGALKRVESKISLSPSPGKMKMRRLLLYGAAAGLAGVVITTYLVHKSKVKASESSIAAAIDIVPGGDKAVLTLENGSTIQLDTLTPGNQIDQGYSKIVKTDSGKLAYVYLGKDEQAEPVKYNAVATPRGGQYRLALPDGTQVWLNAASWIKFPIAFTGNERTVELKGEGYFEVRKNTSQPFHVKTAGADIEVTGTHFNINAYEGEASVKTTLLEGSVKITLQNNIIILRPGEQAFWGSDNKLYTNTNINEEDILGWKNGLFCFHHEDIQDVMKQVSRWYDVEIQYNGQIKNHFNASIERRVSISRLLKLLEGTGDVEFAIKDKTIIVNP
jgi:transmembrane sensor